MVAWFRCFFHWRTVNVILNPQYHFSSKLYTADFFELAKSSLASGGIYSGWFDLRIGAEGISIMLNTLEVSFAQCRYFALDLGHFNVLCSDDALRFQSAETIHERSDRIELEPLLQTQGLRVEYAVILPALEIRFSGEAFERSSEQINRLNLPALEFVQLPKQQAEELRGRLKTLFEKSILLQKFWQTTCLILQAKIYQKLENCE